MSCVKSILTSKTNGSFIENGKVLLSHLFPESIGKFAELMCESWSQIQDVLESALPAGSDTGATLSSTLRKLLSAYLQKRSRRHWLQLQRVRRTS